MNSLQRLKVLQDSMYNATISTVKPLSFFEAKDTVIKYAQKSFELNTDMTNVKYLAPETIAAINAAGFNEADLANFAQTHRYNNAQLRTVASLLMEHSGLTIYEAEKEIRNFLAGNVSKYAPVQDLRNARIHPIDLTHVFERCHKDALHAMIAEANIPFREAFRELAVTSNQLLMTYPQEIGKAKKLIIAEIVDFVSQGKGSMDVAINHVSQLLSAANKTPRQTEIVNIYPLFTKFVFTSKFKDEIFQAINAAVVADAAQDVEKEYTQFFPASIKAGQQTANPGVPSAVAATTTPRSDSFIAQGNQPQLGTTVVMATVRHVNDHAAVYGFSAALIVLVFYCTRNLSHVNPLTPINKVFSALTFWGRKKAQDSIDDPYLSELGRQSGADTDDEESSRLMQQRQRRGRSPHTN
jgi:hypothetical protein